MHPTRQVLKQWPKIDLHRHLEGSLRLETLSEIAREHGVDLPGHEVEIIRPYVQMADEPYTYRGFLAKFSVLRHFYKTKEVIEQIAYEAVADAAEDNVKYLELRFTPSAAANVRGFRLEDVAQWVIRSVRQAETDHDIKVGLIMSMNRHEDMAIGEEIAELAIQYRDDIVGLDLAGDEVAFSALPFSHLFHRAKEAGLGITVHAGEWMGSDNIIEAIEHLSPQRIGHGVRAIEDARAVSFIKDHNITLEICPTSNYQSGVVETLNDHPLADLQNLGLAITINTDDPSVSNIVLTDEYTLAVTELGLSVAGLKQTIMNAAKAAFLPENEKNALISQFEQALHECQL